MLLALLAAGTPAAAASAIPEDGPRYPVDQIYLDFAEDLPVHPPTKLMLQLDTELGVTDTGYVAPRAGLKTVQVKLSDVPGLDKNHMHASAVRAIGDTLVEHFKEWGYTGIVVVPHPDDINPRSEQDERLAGQTALRLIARSMTGRGRPKQVGPIWETANEADGPTFRVSQFLLANGPEADADPSDLNAIRRTPITLAETPTGYIAPRAGARIVQIRAVDVPQLEDRTFHRSALYQITKTLTEAARDRGFGGARVWFSEKDLTGDWEDTRLPGQSAMRLVLQAGDLPVAPADPTADPQPTPDSDPPDGTQIADAEQPAEKTEQPDLPDPQGSDGGLYPVDQVILEYTRENAGLPALSEIMSTEVRLAEIEGGYASPREAAPSINVALKDLPDLPRKSMYGSAIRSINQQLVRAFNQAGYIGIYISPDAADIAPDGTDRRPEGQTALRLDIQSGEIGNVRTLASGDRIDTEDRVDHPKHEEIRQESPVQPGDVLRRDEIDRYVYWLSRHPGRRADVAVSPGTDPGQMNLDLLISESKPWTAYYQFSNTGTEETDEYRHRFGFVHNQLTNNDDVLMIDYITSGFDESHAIIPSYEAPLFDIDRTRFRVHGTYSEFTASEVGFADESFEGDEWSAGGDLIFNVGQWNEAFLDLVVGAKWQNVRVNNNIIGEEGEDDFFLPHVGLEFERVNETSTFLASIDYEINISDIAGTDSEELTRLGRLFADEDAMRMTFDGTYSFFLEPLLWTEQWEDPNTPSSSTLAHELAFSVKGQYAFDTRLNPQRQRTVGGLFSARGYDESLLAGDTVFIANAEYRFHLPRMFTPDPEPDELFGEPFRWAPQNVYGRPDWNLMFRGFFDYASVHFADREPAFEDQTDFASAGVGVEFTFKRNLSLRLDWGYVLQEVETRDELTEEGDDRLHFVGTVLY